MKTPLLILGAGGFAEDVFDIAMDTELFDVIGFACDAGRDALPETLLGKPVYWLEDVIGSLPEGTQVVPGMGSAKRSTGLKVCSDAGLRLANVIHPTARVSSRAHLGQGIVVGPQSTISIGCRLADGVIINRGVTIGHHTQLHACATVAPGANVAGNVVIMDGATIGMGANVIEKITVGPGAMVGSGSVVVKNVDAGVTVVGIPAKPLIKADNK